MKNLLLLALIVTVVSCGESGKNNSQGEVFNTYQDALLAQKEGLVLLSTQSGMEWDIRYDDQTKLFSAFKFPVSYVEREIVLKVNKDQVYKYVESTYSLFTSRRVVLESISLEAKRTEQMLKFVKFKVQGDRLVGTMKMNGYEVEYDSGEGIATINGGENIIAISLSRNNILCDNNSTTTSTKQVFTSPTERTVLGNVSSTYVASCPKKMTMAELKQIDLTSIQFCDESKETDEYNCEDDFDMSFLTEDL